MKQKTRISKMFMGASDLGYWDDDPEWPLQDWKYDVQNGDTRLGYWEWVKYNKEIENE